jgi:hypothetical protein
MSTFWRRSYRRSVFDVELRLRLTDNRDGMSYVSAHRYFQPTGVEGGAILVHSIAGALTIHVWPKQFIEPGCRDAGAHTRIGTDCSAVAANLRDPVAVIPEKNSQSVAEVPLRIKSITGPPNTSRLAEPTQVVS